MLLTNSVNHIWLGISPHCIFTNKFSSFRQDLLTNLIGYQIKINIKSQWFVLGNEISKYYNKRWRFHAENAKQIRENLRQIIWKTSNWAVRNGHPDYISRWQNEFIELSALMYSCFYAKQESPNLFNRRTLNKYLVI